MRLLVGYDGDGGGRDALELARVLGSAEGAGALLVTVMPYGPLPIDFAELEDDTAAAAEPLLAEARRQLAGPGRSPRPLPGDGRAAAGLAGG
jgi:nucleotide-binding universal stress UspA family protein